MVEKFVRFEPFSMIFALGPKQAVVINFIKTSLKL